MKKSRYNIIVRNKDNTVVIFNGLSKKYVIVSAKYIEQYIQFLEKPNEYIRNHNLNGLTTTFRSCGFIVEDDMDEYRFIKELFTQRVNSLIYSLVIMTTYECNFRCWYCMQHHKDISITANIENRIKKHITNYLKTNKIKHFDLSWFGGEPLLNIPVIESISMYALNFCKDNNIGFSCGITTNGSLLSEELLKRLNELRFRDFQITIDGNKEYHNKTKRNNSICNSFDLILRNIVLTVQNIPDARVTMRINYTHTNITSDFPAQIDEILSPVRDKISILFRQVWQEQDLQQDDISIIPIMNQLKKIGYKVEHEFNDFTVISCYVEKKHYLSIFPNGSVDNCNNKSMKDARGYLDEKGNVVWNVQSNERAHNIFDVNSACQECKYLPICMGPCPATREKNKGKIECNISDRDTIFSNQIIQYCMISKPL